MLDRWLTKQQQRWLLHTHRHQHRRAQHRITPAGSPSSSATTVPTAAVGLPRLALQVRWLAVQGITFAVGAVDSALADHPGSLSLAAHNFCHHQA
jgi:hypothetical protein